jgi:hypothetical protein
MLATGTHGTRPMSRPTDCTPVLRGKILNLVRRGNYRRTACEAAGITIRTLQKWILRGESGEEPYATFAADLREAEAYAESFHVDHIANAAEQGDWKASAWFLARKLPEHWAERPAPPPETKTAEVAAAELAELLTQAGWKVTPPDDSADGHGAQGEPATGPVVPHETAEAEPTENEWTTSTPPNRTT